MIEQDYTQQKTVHQSVLKAGISAYWALQCTLRWLLVARSGSLTPSVIRSALGLQADLPAQNTKQKTPDSYEPGCQILAVVGALNHRRIDSAGIIKATNQWTSSVQKCLLCAV